MVTGFYAGIFALIFVALSFNVILRRRHHGVPFGDKGIATLNYAIRVHGNFAEYVPMTLLCILLIEIQGGSTGKIHTLCIMLVVARLLHIFALTKGNFQARVVGTALTQLIIAICGVMLILRSFGI